MARFPLQIYLGEHWQSVSLGRVINRKFGLLLPTKKILKQEATSRENHGRFGLYCKYYMYPIDTKRS